jgi:HlyD family secretion protein
MSDVTLPPGPAAEPPRGALAPRPTGAPPALWQPAEEALVLDAPRPRTRAPVLFGWVIVLVFVVGFGAWAAITPLAEAAIAAGLLKVEGTRRTVQHFEGGIVREILVRDGDQVRQGQVLLRLDQPQAGQQTETLRSQRWALVAQDARLMAELAGNGDIAFPAELSGHEAARAQDAVAGQINLFQARRIALDTQMTVLQARIEQFEAQIRSSEAQREAQSQQMVLLRAEESNTATLLAQGLARLPQLLAIQRQVAATVGNIADMGSQIERSRAQIAESEREMRRLRDTRIQEVSTELREVRVRLAITAPEAGTVINLRVFTLGAVVRSGDPVMEIVPVRDRIIAEVNVQPNDIEVIHPGLQAEIRLPAFKSRLVPYLHGTVTFVASDVTEDDRRGTAYYRVQIEIDESQLRALEGVQLRPGMMVEALIRTGERSFARYLLQPVFDSFHRAFREQ